MPPRIPLPAPVPRGPEPWAYILYSAVGAPVWHQRRRLAALSGSLGTGEWAVTPDGGVFEESLHLPDPEVTAVRFADVRWPPPPGVPRAQAYRFAADIPAEDLANYMDEAMAQANQVWTQEMTTDVPPSGVLEDIRASVDVGRVAPAPGLPPQAVEPAEEPGVAVLPLAGVARNVHMHPRGVLAEDPRCGDGYVWALDEHVSEHHPKGQIVHLPAGCFGDSERALGPAPLSWDIVHLVQYLAVDPRATPRASDMAVDQGTDARVFPVKFDAHGERVRLFAESVSYMTQDELPGGFPLEGPRTCLQVLKGMVRVGGSPEMSNLEWRRTSRIPDGDRAVYEDEVICLALQFLATVDQVNLPNLVGAELLCRRHQLIREAYRLSPSALDYSVSDWFMGWGRRRTGQTVQPPPAVYVAEQLKHEASIVKESRKAREEKMLKAPRAPKGGPKGLSKGDTGAGSS